MRKEVKNTIRYAFLLRYCLSHCYLGALAYARTHNQSNRCHPCSSDVVPCRCLACLLHSIAVPMLSSVGRSSRTRVAFAASRVFSASPNAKQHVKQEQPQEPIPVPTPSGNWPIVGHLPRLMQLGDKMKWNDMHEECGEIFKVNILGKEIIVTSSADHAREN